MKKTIFICFSVISIAAIATTSSIKPGLILNSASVTTMYDTVPQSNSRSSKSKNKNSHSKTMNQNDSTGTNSTTGRTSSGDYNTGSTLDTNSSKNSGMYNNDSTSAKPPR